jgi:hypothetical protein
MDLKVKIHIAKHSVNFLSMKAFMKECGEKKEPCF